MSSPRRLAAYLLLALIPLGFLAIFFFYPLLAIFRLSLFPEGRLAVTALQEMAATPYYGRVLWFTTWQAALSTLGAFAVGLPVAYIFSHYRFPGKNLLRGLTTLPFVMPAVVVAAAFGAFLGPRGLLNALAVDWLGWDTPPIRLANTVWIILLAHVFYNTSIVIRLVGGFWANLDPRLGAAAAVLGASPWRRFRHITLALLTPSLAAAGVLVFLFNFTSFGVVLILGGARFATLEVEIYRSAVRLFNLPAAAVLALVQLGFTLVLLVIYTRLQARITGPLSLRPSRAHERVPRSWTEKALVYGSLSILGCLLAAPFLALILRSLTLGGGFGLQHYRNLFINRTGSVFFITPVEAVRNSLLFAVATVALSLIIGVASAYLLAGGRGGRSKIASLLDPVFMLPLGASAVTLGFGFLIALDEPPLNLRASLALIPIAHTLIAFPFVLRALLPVLRSLDPRLREAAATLGAGPIRVLRHIDAPILSRALIVGVVFAFTVSMGEFSASLLVSRPQFLTLPVAIYRFLGQPGVANYGQALALSVILLLVTVLAFLGLENLRYDDIGEF